MKNVTHDVLEKIQCAQKHVLHEFQQLFHVNFGTVDSEEHAFELFKNCVRIQTHDCEKEHNSFSSITFQWMNKNTQITAWHQRIRQILINCGIPFAEMYSGYIADAEVKKYVKDRCNELAFQSWQVTIHNNSLCDNYRLYKHRLDLETYLKLLKGPAK